MGTPLPSDPIVLEQTIRGRMKDIFESVPLIAAGNAIVSTRERFPDNEDSDIQITTVPDPVNSDIRLTSIIQIGMPTVQEWEYTNDKNTNLMFVYPITFDRQVTDKWDNDNNALVYDNSTDLVLAIYMQSRRRFKFEPDGTSNRDLGFQNCVHEFLQQEAIGTVDDEENDASLHVADWSLTVKVTGILN